MNPMKLITSIFASALLPLFLCQVAHAELKTEYVMSLDIANTLARNVMQSCQSKAAAVVVLDQGGNVIASQRHESVGPHNLIAAQRKAFTAYSSKNSTLDFMRNAQKNLHHLFHLNQVFHQHRPYLKNDSKYKNLQ